MRTDLTFKALTHEPNRFRLAKLLAKATRMLHRPNTRVQDTMNDALEWFGCSIPGAIGVTQKDSSVQKSVLRPNVSFDLTSLSPLQS
jgi:hypothetical protein